MKTKNEKEERQVEEKGGKDKENDNKQVE